LTPYSVESHFREKPDFSVSIKVYRNDGLLVAIPQIEIQSGGTTEVDVGIFSLLMNGDFFDFLCCDDYQKTIPNRNMAYRNSNCTTIMARDRIILDNAYKAISLLVPDCRIIFRPTKISSIEIEWLATGVGTYVLVKDYPNLRKGLEMLSKDICLIGGKLFSAFSDEAAMKERLKTLQRIEPSLRACAKTDARPQREDLR